MLICPMVRESSMVQHVAKQLAVSEACCVEWTTELGNWAPPHTHTNMAYYPLPQSDRISPATPQPLLCSIGCKLYNCKASEYGHEIHE